MAFYTEQFETFQASGSAGVWEDKVLSIFGIPASAVVEVALLNTSNANERSCGVRAVGSIIDNRRISINKDEALGLDTYTMHVQSDVNSKIQIYAENLSDIFFRPLGYWTSGIYIETRNTFNASSVSTWEESDLSSFGVSGEKVCEIVITNNNTAAERIGGVRSINSTLGRLAQLHEAEDGGNDAVTMFVNSNKDSKIEINADNTTDIAFTLMGYWDPPPGSYVEKFEDIGSPSVSNTWEDVDLSSFTIPASAVVEILVGNQDTLENDQLGVRQTGSSLGRVLDLRDAEAGGTDFGRMHVNIDPNNTIQFFHQDITDPHVFRAIGYWTQEKSASMTLFISGPPFNEMDLYIGGQPSGEIPLFIGGFESVSEEIPLFMSGGFFEEISLFIKGKPSGEIDQFIQGHIEFNAFLKVEDGDVDNSTDLFIYGGSGGAFEISSMNLFIEGSGGSQTIFPAFLKASDDVPLTSGNVTWPAFIKVGGEISSRSVSLFINAGPNVFSEISLMTGGHNPLGSSVPITDLPPFSEDYEISSGIFASFVKVTPGFIAPMTMFIEGKSFPSGVLSLFMSGVVNPQNGTMDLFTSGFFLGESGVLNLVMPATIDDIVGNIGLFIPGGGC